MTPAFGLLVLGGVFLVSAIRNRTVQETLSGITSTKPDTTATALDKASAVLTSLVSGATGPVKGAAQTTGAVIGGQGLVHFDGTLVCAWIARELQIARERGWQGSVTSGYRSPADQARACAETSGPCAPPGQSNHQGKRYPKCAVDVSDAEGLARALRPNSPLHWTGKSIGDDVHFSSGKNGV